MDPPCVLPCTKPHATYNMNSTYIDTRLVTGLYDFRIAILMDLPSFLTLSMYEFTLPLDMLTFWMLWTLRTHTPSQVYSCTPAAVCFNSLSLEAQSRSVTMSSKNYGFFTAFCNSYAQWLRLQASLTITKTCPSSPKVCWQWELLYSTYKTPQIYGNPF